MLYRKPFLNALWNNAEDIVKLKSNNLRPIHCEFTVNRKEMKTRQPGKHLQDGYLDESLASID